MDNKKFGAVLEKRTRKFAVRIIYLSSKLPNTPEGRVIRNQITKSGTSIGANYRGANHYRGKADFKSKIRICESEARRLSENALFSKLCVMLKKLSSKYQLYVCGNFLSKP